MPSSFFLPEDVRPLKEKLDYASARRAGSPHFAIVVNNEVFDYFFGIRSAEQVEKMIETLRDGTPYPFTPCKRIAGLNRCEISGNTVVQSENDAPTQIQKNLGVTSH